VATPAPKLAEKAGAEPAAPVKVDSSGTVEERLARLEQ